MQTFLRAGTGSPVSLKGQVGMPFNSNGGSQETITFACFCITGYQAVG